MSTFRQNIPNFVTSLNILSGLIAIYFAFSSGEHFGCMDGWQIACIAIGCAAIFDFFDGFLARLLGAYSELGKQLDSLSDLVSFGVAPAMLLLNVLLSLNHSGWAFWPMIALIIPIMGALRLARFNIDPRQSTEFIGLPIPANAIFWIGYVALINDGCEYAAYPAIAIPVIILEALSMVSQLRMFSLKFKNYKWQGNQFRWIILFLSLIAICCMGLPALLLIIILYFILSLIKR